MPDVFAQDSNNPSNSTRAEWALAALTAFAEATGDLDLLEEAPITVLVDLLTDLRHMVDDQTPLTTIPACASTEWDEAVRRSELHYFAEVEVTA